MNVSHRSLFRLLTQHVAEFEEIAPVRFEIAVGGSRSNGTCARRPRAADGAMSNRTLSAARDLAEVFGKRHDNVLRSIEAKRRSRSPVIASWARLNFEECSYIDRGRPRPCYRMTAKGMAELTMGCPQ